MSAKVFGGSLSKVSEVRVWPARSRDGLPAVRSRLRTFHAAHIFFCCFSLRLLVHLADAVVDAASVCLSGAVLPYRTLTCSVFVDVLFIVFVTF